MEKFSPIVDELKEAHDKRLRKEKTPWIGIVVHHTDVSNKWATMTDEEKEKNSDNIASYLAKLDENYVSAHFQINPSGKIIQLVDPRTHVAYHAGVSTWYHPIQKKMVSGMNDHMIGIELVGDGNKYPYTDEQYRSCAKLCNVLRVLNQTIRMQGIVGHEAIAIGRKNDPGKLFAWDYLELLMGFVS